MLMVKIIVWIVLKEPDFVEQLLHLYISCQSSLKAGNGRYNKRSLYSVLIISR